MSENIFTTELISKYNTKSRTSGIGEWVTRNGEPSIAIKPEPFYINLPNEDSGILVDEFKPNTQYIVDMWLDVDDVIYNSNNVTGGLYVYYTDGTSESFVFQGPRGWVHKRIVTPVGKTVKKISSSYYTNTNVYYRWDSFICPLDKCDMHKNGNINTANVTESVDTATLYKGGNCYINDLIEY